MYGKRKKGEKGEWRKIKRQDEREIEDRQKQAKQGKIKNFRRKKRGEGTSKMWYLKHKISEDLHIKFLKMQQQVPYLPPTSKNC